MWVLSMRVIFVEPSFACKDHSHENSVIPAILKRGYYVPQVKFCTLHAIVISAGPCLPSKDHSHEHSVILAILKRGYYPPQVNVGPCQHLQVCLASFMLEHHFHPIIGVSLIITPNFLGGCILSTYSTFARGGFIVLTSSLFSRIVHIFDLFLLFE